MIEQPRARPTITARRSIRQRRGAALVSWALTHDLQGLRYQTLDVSFVTVRFLPIIAALPPFPRRIPVPDQLEDCCRNNRHV